MCDRVGGFDCCYTYTSETATHEMAARRPSRNERPELEIFIAMALGIVLGATVFPERLKGINASLTLISTGLLIFCMGADLGARDELMGQLANLGFSSLVLCLVPVLFSTVLVYVLTSVFMKDITSRHVRERSAQPHEGQGRAVAPASCDGPSSVDRDCAEEASAPQAGSELLMIAIAVGSLAAGVAYGVSPLDLALVGAVVAHSDFVLYALMFFVGISVGGAKGLVGKIREYGVRLLLVPAGIIVGSFLAGLACAPLCGLSFGEGAAIASGMGWYSLVGVVLADLAGAQVGSIAFLANLLRELVSFLIIPWIARNLNYPTCLAPAGATSEDTTLPMIIRCTNEETVVLGVINGVVCSAAALVLVAVCAQFM